MDRAQVRGISEELEKLCNDWAQKRGLVVKIGGGHFDSASFEVKMRVTEIDNNGKLKYSSTDITLADMGVRAKGVKFEGHILGSQWKLNDGRVMTINHYTRRGRYNLHYHCWDDGKDYKGIPAMLFTATQILKPTEDDFKDYFSVSNIDDDRISRSCEQAYDKVNDWISYQAISYPEESDKLDKVFDLIDKNIKHLRTRASRVDFMNAADGGGDSMIKFLTKLSNL